MTDLRSALERYLSMRKGLGYKYQHQTRRLTDFVSFMEKCAAATITTKLALEWATLPPDRHASWALRLSDVRGLRASCRQSRSKNRGAACRHAPQSEAGQALCVQRLRDQCVAGGGAGPAAGGWASPMDLSHFVRADRCDRNAPVRGDGPGARRRRPGGWRAHASSDQVRQVAPRALASDDVHGAAPPTSIGAPHISEPVAARPSSSPSRAAGCCTSTCTASSGACRARSVCAGLAIEPGHACMTSGIPSPSGRCSAGIGMGETSRRSCLHSPHISATPACAIPTGTSRPARS